MVQTGFPKKKKRFLDDSGGVTPEGGTQPPNLFLLEW